MVEDYDSGIRRTDEDADSAAKEISVKINGLNDWNVAGYPDNMTLLPNNSPVAIYVALNHTGPLYAFYEGQNDENGSGHYIVITGIDLDKGLIYTNNPWGYSGSQTFNEFQDGFLRGNNHNWELKTIYFSR